MSDSDYIKNCGREQMLKEELQARETRLKCLVEQLHDKADPLDDLAALPAKREDIFVLAKQLYDESVEFDSLQAKLANVRKALGR
jgi:hypothetical protein